MAQISGIHARASPRSDVSVCNAVVTDGFLLNKTQYRCASGVVYANYKSAIDVFEGGAGIRTVPGYSPNATGKQHGIALTTELKILTFMSSRDILYLSSRVYGTSMLALS